VITFRLIEEAASPQHIAERLRLSVWLLKDNSRLRLEVRRSRKMNVLVAGKPEAYRSVLRQSRDASDK
jgi:hypothetical protein